MKVRQLREVVGAVQQSGEGSDRGSSRAAGGGGFRPASAAASGGGGASATSSMRAELSASRRYGGMSEDLSTEVQCQIDYSNNINYGATAALKELLV